jgi:hypothetical protein
MGETQLFKWHQGGEVICLQGGTFGYSGVREETLIPFPYCSLVSNYPNSAGIYSSMTMAAFALLKKTLILLPFFQKRFSPKSALGFFKTVQIRIQHEKLLQEPLRPREGPSEIA